MYSQTDDRVQDILRRGSMAKSDRSVWETHWTEIARLVFPAYSDMFIGGGLITPGEKKTDFLIDSTAPSALLRFGSVMESILTPRGQTWHHLRPVDPYLGKDRQTKLWFEEANNLLFRYRYAPLANFASVQNEGYMSLGAFGTKCKFVDKLQTQPGIRYKSISLGEVYIQENHQGIVDTVYRYFKMKGRQMMQQFGDKVPKDIYDEYKACQDKDYDVVHCVRPRTDRDPRRLDYRGKKYESLYICEKHKKILEEGGYNTIPYIVSRYSTISGEKYGRSPAMTVLPAIKTLNEEKRTVLKQGQRVVDPVLLLHDDGALDSFSLKAGAMNFGGMSAEGRRLVDVLPTGNIAVGRDMMEDERVTINDAFLITLFQILVETPAMTATEVLERAREKAALLAPIAGRQESEDLGPMIDREIDLLMQQSLLPPFTPAMREAGAQFRVEYDSPMTRMQKSESAAGGIRTLQIAAEISAQTQDPSAMDWINVDEMMPDIAEAQAMPPSWVRDQAQVDQIRKGRQDQASTQQMIEAAPSMAAMMKATTQQ
jgi:hypothetical protein